MQYTIGPDNIEPSLEMFKIESSISGAFQFSRLREEMYFGWDIDPLFGDNLSGESVKQKPCVTMCQHQTKTE